MENRTLKVRKIKHGIVIDHISNGIGEKIMKLLKIDTTKYTTILATRLESKKLGVKDILKIEGFTPNEKQLNVIFLLSPKATINFIENWNVVKKIKARPPKRIVGLLSCPNAKCITNDEREKKHLTSTFELVEGNRSKFLRCRYCGYLLDFNEVPKYVVV